MANGQTMPNTPALIMNNIIPQFAQDMWNAAYNFSKNVRMAEAEKSVETSTAKEKARATAEEAEKKQIFLNTLKNAGKWDMSAIIYFNDNYTSPTPDNWNAFLLFNWGEEKNYWIIRDERGYPTVYEYDYNTKKTTTYPGEYNVKQVQRKMKEKQLLEKLKEEKIPYEASVFSSYYYSPIEFQKPKNWTWRKVKSLSSVRRFK